MKQIFYFNQSIYTKSRCYGLLLVFCLLTLSCHNHNHEHEHDHEHGCDHDHDHGEDQLQMTNDELQSAILFTEMQASKIDFLVEPPAFEPLGEVIRTTARVGSDRTDEQELVARTSGIVVFAKNRVTEGQRVAAGETLFYISGSGMADNSVNVRLVEAQSAYVKAESAYRRSQELAKDRIVSEKELDLVRSEYESTKAVYDNLVRGFSEKGQAVRGTISGFVRQLSVSNGQYVETGQRLVGISRNESLLLQADVPTRYAPLLPLIVSATVRRPHDGATFRLADLNGELLSFGRSVSEGHYLLPVTFRIDNAAGFIPGGFVELFIVTLSKTPVVSVPKGAIVESQGAYFVFVQVGPERYEKREVNIGVSDGIRTAIVSGLSSEDRVVTKGAVAVQLAEGGGALDPHAGHSH